MIILTEKLEALHIEKMDSEGRRKLSGPLPKEDIKNERKGVTLHKNDTQLCQCSLFLNHMIKIMIYDIYDIINHERWLSPTEKKLESLDDVGTSGRRV